MVGAEFAAGQLACRRLLPAQCHRAGWPAQAVGGGKAELAGLQGHTLGIALPDQPPRHVGECQCITFGVWPQHHIAQRHIQRGRIGSPVSHGDPRPQRTTALRQTSGQRDVRRQRSDIDLRHAEVQRALPARPVRGFGQQRLGETACQRDRLTPGGGRCRIDTQVVSAQTVAHHPLHIAETLWLSRMQGITPAHDAVAQHHFMLPEEPVGQRTVVGARSTDLEPGHEDPAVGITMGFEVGSIDEQLREARLQGQQRLRRQRADHARQLQHWPGLVVEQGHVAQLQRRQPAVGVDNDRADAHRLPEKVAGVPFDRRSPLVDVRQNQKVQRQPCRDQQAPCCGQQQAQCLDGAKLPPHRGETLEGQCGDRVVFWNRHRWCGAPGRVARLRPETI